MAICVVLGCVSATKSIAFCPVGKARTTGYTGVKVPMAGGKLFPGLFGPCSRPSFRHTEVEERRWVVHVVRQLRWDMRQSSIPWQNLKAMALGQVFN